MLLREIEQQGLEKDMLARFLGISEEAFKRKLEGRQEFTVDEALRLRELLCPMVPLALLFRKKQGYGTWGKHRKDT